MKIRLPIAIALLLWVCSATIVNAQTHIPRYISMAPSTNAYYEYLPDNYNSGTGTYPLIIFFCGIGEIGDGSPSQLTRVLSNGTPRQINQGTFPTSFTVNNQTYKFIVITPQFNGYPSVQDIDAVIEYTKQTYRVDANRIYLTGLSWGGGMVWSYLSGGVPLASKIAAAIPVCGSADIASWGGGNTVALADVPIWATHNSGDNVVPLSTTVNNVNSINNSPQPPTPPAKQTIFNVNGHDAWSRTYDLTYRENGLNAYEWMLQFSRNITGPVPVTGLTFDAFRYANNIQLKWTTASEINNAGFIIQRSVNGTSFDSIGYVASNSTSGNGAIYEFIDAFPLSTGAYYRLKQMDANGVNFSYSPIRYVPVGSEGSGIQIFPNPITNRELSVRFAAPVTGEVRLQVFNITGQMLLDKEIHNNNGGSNISVQLPANMQKGLYTLRVENDGKIETVKMNKL